MRHGGTFALLRCSITHWLADNASTTGAALAFYCAFSLAPLLVILLTIAAAVLGPQQAYGQIGTQLAALFGPATAQVLLEGGAWCAAGAGACCDHHQRGDTAGRLDHGARGAGERAARHLGGAAPSGGYRGSAPPRARACCRWR